MVGLMSLATGSSYGRSPTAVDRAFCDRYAAIMQQALVLERRGDTAEISRFRQSVIRDPQAYLITPGLGDTTRAPPWITDVTDESRMH